MDDASEHEHLGVQLERYVNTLPVKITILRYTKNKCNFTHFKEVMIGRPTDRPTTDWQGHREDFYMLFLYKTLNRSIPSPSVYIHTYFREFCINDDYLGAQKESGWSRRDCWVLNTLQVSKHVPQNCSCRCDERSKGYENVKTSLKKFNISFLRDGRCEGRG